MGLRKKLSSARKRIRVTCAERRFDRFKKFKKKTDFQKYKDEVVPERYEFFRKLPIRKNKVFFESLADRKYNDNPKAVFLELQGRRLGYKSVWGLSAKKDAVRVARSGGEAVPYRSLRYYYHLATAKYIVSNINQFQLVKREGQVVINTMHGIPFKHMGLDVVKTASTRENMKRVFWHDWDYLITRCDFMTEVLRGSAYEYKGPILEVGYPRDDSLVQSIGDDEPAAKVRKKLGIPAEKKIILYAPTWRSKKRCDLKLDFAKMREALGEDYVLLVRTHYFETKFLDDSIYDDFVMDGHGYDNVNDMLVAADVLVTDYSSIMFDYALLERPIVLFTWDYEKYVEKSRGTYFDLKTDYPQLVACTTDEVIAKIGELAAGDEVLKRFNERFNQYDKGAASKGIADFFWGTPAQKAAVAVNAPVD